MIKELNQAILLIQRIIKLLAITGNIKNVRYLRTALANLQNYKQLAKKGEVSRHDKGRRSKTS